MDTSALFLLEYMCSDTMLCETHINTYFYENKNTRYFTPIYSILGIREIKLPSLLIISCRETVIS